MGKSEHHYMDCPMPDLKPGESHTCEICGTTWTRDEKTISSHSEGSYNE